MSHFIRLSGGYINLDLVNAIHEPAEAAGGLVIEWADGGTMLVGGVDGARLGEVLEEQTLMHRAVAVGVSAKLAAAEKLAHIVLSGPRDREIQRAHELALEILDERAAPAPQTAGR